MKYRHMSLEEREKLYAMREQGKTYREIGKVLGRSHTSLSREYKRNAKYGAKYVPCRAQSQAERVAKKQRYKAPLKNPKVFLYVRQKLRKKWSPETIAGRLTLDHPDESIHHETIYRYIYNPRKTTSKMQLWQHLTLHRKRRMKRGGRKVKASRYLRATPLVDRPKEAEGRQVAGHWETDNLGGKISDKKALSGNIERKTRYVQLDLLGDKTSQTKMRSIKSRTRKLPVSLRKTMTIDNGPENAKHELVKDTFDQGVYSCQPYHSWEKGAVENMLGRVRRFIPKGTSLDTLDNKTVKQIEHWLNHTPRKCLGYATPYEKMQEELQHTSINSGALPLRM